MNGDAVQADEEAKPVGEDTVETTGSVDRDDEVKALKEQIRRAQADFENYRRRQQNSQEEMRLQAKERIIEAFLPLKDNLQRAVEAARSTQNLESLIEGLNLVMRQMGETFTKEGVVEISAQGATFDPKVHHAVVSEDRDDVPDQTVLEEFQKGYKLGDRVLRPSLVKVARNEAPAPTHTS